MPYLHKYEELIVAIATCGGSPKLEDIVTSVDRGARKVRFAGIKIVENGTKGNVEAIVHKYRENINVDYYFSPEGNKSKALNIILRDLPGDTLVVMLDDDIEVPDNLLIAYEKAASESDGGRSFFGGGLKVKGCFEGVPDWKKQYLPGSMSGWVPSEREVNNLDRLFYGANWAAFAGHLQDVGYFDPRFGPGSKLRATGQESQMQRRLLAAGLKQKYVETVVVHFVPDEKYSLKAISARLERHGCEGGIIAADQITLNVKAFARTTLSVLESLLKIMWLSAKILLSVLTGREITRDRATLELSRSRGFIRGFVLSRISKLRADE